LKSPIKIIFFNIENYVDFQKESQNFLVRLPIINCGLEIEYRDFMHQRELKKVGREATEKRALALVEEFEPDILVYSHTWRYGDLSPEFFRTVRERGIKVISCIWDSYLFPAYGEMLLFQNSDALLVADSLNAYLRWRVLASLMDMKVQVGLCMGCYYFPENEPQVGQKKRDVTIIGSLFGKRLELANFLSAKLAIHGISFHTVGGMYNESHKEFGFKETWLDWMDYARIIRESKICLNSQNQEGRVQIKGKIFEIAGRGGFCLTDANTEARRMLPADTFSMYNSFEDCLEQIIYFTKHEDERHQREQKAKKWVEKHCDYRKFYQQFMACVMNGDKNCPTHDFLSREFKLVMENKLALVPAAADLVGAHIESLISQNML
jgi:glycosyl transferase family 1